MTTISSRLTSYQLSRKEHLILKVPVTWLTSHHRTQLLWPGRGWGTSGTRGERVIEGGSFHLLVLGMVM